MSRRMLAALLILWTLAAGCASSTALNENARGLDSASADVRREAALDLGTTRVRDPDLRQRLIRRLSVMGQSDPDPLVRSAALTALEMQQVEAGLDLAKRLRTDTHPMVRRDAVAVMARHGGESVTDVLIEVALKDPDEQVRREAARALGSYEAPPVVSALIACLGDDSPAVVHAARASLVHISGGVDFGTDAEAWRKWLE